MTGFSLGLSGFQRYTLKVFMLGFSEATGSTVVVDSRVAYERAKAAGRKIGRDAAKIRDTERREAMAGKMWQ